MAHHNHPAALHSLLALVVVQEEAFHTLLAVAGHTAGEVEHHTAAEEARRSLAAGHHIAVVLHRIAGEVDRHSRPVDLAVDAGDRLRLWSRSSSRWRREGAL